MTKQEFIVNCSSIGLTSIPETFPNSTTHLLLNNNHLLLIPNNAFKNLSHLVCLDISNSGLYKMEKMAFHHLTNLKTLILKNNHLSASNASYPDGIFCPFENELETLDIRGNLKGLAATFHTYPEKALGCLKSLEVLRMDCIPNLNLPGTLSQMHNLTTLDFSNGLQVHNVTNGFFNSVSNLQIETLNFTNANITQINGSIFNSLKSLRVLDLTNNSKLAFIVKDICFGLRQTKIEILNLTRTCFGAAKEEHLVMQQLNQTNITVLALDWNEIRSVGSIFSILPYIEEFTMTNNGLNDFYGLLLDFGAAKQIRKMDFSYQNTFILETTEPVCPDYPNVKSDVSEQEHTFHSDPNKRFCSFGDVCLTRWPPKLEWMAFSDVGLRKDKVPEIAFMNNGSIKYVDLSNNIIEALPRPMYCRSKNPYVISTIEHLDASNCGMKCMNKTLFEYCDWSVKFVNVSHNKLGLLQGGCNENPSVRDLTTLLKPLKTLEYIDVSYNFINKTTSDVFDNQVNLIELRVSNNELTSLEINLTHLIHLELLDLSFNKITTLSETARLTLSQLEAHPEFRTTKHIYLNLAGNPLQCTCSGLGFLSWMANTRLTLVNLPKYRCVYSNSREGDMSDGINQIVATMERECGGNKWFILSLTGLFLYFTTVTIGTCCYRYRHYIRYILLRMRMRRERLDALLGRHNEYKYDGFVCCTREGAKWTKRFLLPNLENKETGLKFCVAQRDFIVGKTIIDNIMDTIAKSRKTILLIDPTFIESKWCNEELLISHNVSGSLCLCFYNQCIV